MEFYSNQLKGDYSPFEGGMNRRRRFEGDDLISDDRALTNVFIHSSLTALLHQAPAKRDKIMTNP